MVALTQTAESVNDRKAKFLAKMSHRIRTPMNAIMGFTDLALERGLNPELREHLNAVRTSADWLMHIANDVLEFSRVEAGTVKLNRVPFSISECLGSAIKILEREASARNVATACKIDSELPEMVCGDPVKLRHVVLNLLDYAVRFTSRESIILSARMESNSADEVLVRVAVTDTGVGSRPAMQSPVVEPFRRTHPREALKCDASSLGLEISRQLVDQMGGTMDSRDESRGDCTFEFTAPFKKHEGLAELDSPVRSHDEAGHKELSVLIAEDNATNRRLITKVLESAGHRVWIATNGKEAVHNVQTEGFDLILMDMEMPDMNGVEATRAIRAAEAPGLHVPIYALTAHASSSDRDRCLDGGMDGFLTKPIAANEILQLVSKIAQSTPNRSTNDIDAGDKAHIAETSESLIAAEYRIAKVDGNADTVTASENSSLDFGISDAGPASSACPESPEALIAERTQNEFTTKRMHGEPPSVSEAAEASRESEDSTEDSAEADFVLSTILRASAAVGLSTRMADSHISEADAIPSTDLVEKREARDLAANSDLLSMAPEPVGSDSSDATRPAFDAQIEERPDLDGQAAETPLMPHGGSSDDYVSQEASQGAEIISILSGVQASQGKPEGGEPAPNNQVSAPAGLVLLGATCQVMQELPQAVKQDDSRAPAPAGDPFAQARKSLSQSTFAVRVIHNDGDPSDRNLI